MEFLTSTIIGGIVYDILKSGVTSTYDIATQALSKYTSNETSYQDFEKILNEIKINNALTKDEIIKKLEENGKTQNILQQINNINITNNYYDKQTIKIPLEKIDIKMRNFEVDFYFAMILFFINLYFINNYQISLLITIMFIMGYILYIPTKFPLMYVYVYEDRFIYLNNIIYYKDIKNFGYINNAFRFRMRLPKYREIKFYNNENAFFLFDAINRYSMHTGTKL